MEVIYLFSFNSHVVVKGILLKLLSSDIELQHLKMADGMLLLSWNSHHATFCDILSRLREKENFTDVTLACEGKCYPLHKLVLSTCSEYLEKIFKSTPCKHPVIVLQDIKCSELEALINYMYVGEVNVPQSSLSLLIKAAELLQVKGLAVPDEPPSGNKMKVNVHNMSDDRTSSQIKRRKCEESITYSQREYPQVSSNSSPLCKERKQTEHSKIQVQNADQVIDQHQTSEKSLGYIEDAFVETDIKEEVLEDIDTDNDLGIDASDPGLNYQTHNSSYEMENVRTEHDTGGKCSIPLTGEYDKQPLNHSEMLSHPPIVSDVAVSSELQGMELFGSSLISKSRGGYNRWTPEERLQIAKACTEMGPSKAARELSHKLNRKLSESTVRNIHKRYLRMMKKGQLKDNSSSLPSARAGRPRLHQTLEENNFSRYIRMMIKRELGDPGR
ncbi:zinc finger protein 131 isoform X12 [Procambarus clarkii]|uniref:zinc finger protein 131 isoform X12 n=1 Tax=Procambarus clarkii TaxID=6728 RepID=UPI001E678C53|nr:zinc finger protein 131-like isoform X11 [Procambarus clarkii]